MWSLGCILAELFNLQTFVAGANITEYVDSLLRFLGQPNKEMKEEIKNKRLVVYMNEQIRNSRMKSFCELIPTAPGVAIDLISKLLTWDPKQRLTAK